MRIRCPTTEAFPFQIPHIGRFAESAANEIMAKRMNKKQQMRWNRHTVQQVLGVRIHVLNDILEKASRVWHVGFRPISNEATMAA